MPDDPIRCTDAGVWEEPLSALIDGELASASEAELLTHLDACAACRTRLAAFRGVDERLRATTLPALPVDLAERLQRRIEAQEAGAGRDTSRTLPGRAAPPRRSRWLGAPLAAAVAAAAALALYLAIEPGAAPPGEAPSQLAREGAPATPDALPSRIAEGIAEAPAVPPNSPEAPALAPTPLEVATADPVPAPVPEPADVIDPVFDGEPAEDIALALELETVEDFDVIANLEILEALIALDGGTG